MFLNELNNCYNNSHIIYEKNNCPSENESAVSNNIADIFEENKKYREEDCNQKKILENKITETSLFHIPVELIISIISKLKLDDIIALKRVSKDYCKKLSESRLALYLLNQFSRSLTFKGKIILAIQAGTECKNLNLAFPYDYIRLEGNATQEYKNLFKVFTEKCTDLQSFHLIRNITLSSITINEIINKLPTTIKELSVFFNQNFNDIDLSRFTSLERLDACYTEISDKTISTLPTTIKELKVNSCKNCTDIDLSRFTSLERLDASYTKISDKTISTLPTTIKELNVLGCENFNDIDLSRLTGLERLDASNTKISAETISTLPTTIKELKLHSCKNCTDIDLSKFTSLERLDASYTKISDTNISTLPIKIKELNVHSCENFNDIDLSRFSRLKILDASFTKISNATINKLPNTIKKLKLHSCKNCTDIDLSRFTKLERFDASLMQL